MNIIKRIIVVLLILFIPTMSALAQEIIIRHFSKNRKVIPLYYNQGKLKITNIKLPDIVINNNSDSKQKLEKVEVIAKNDNHELIRYTLSGDEGKELSSKINQQIKILKKADELYRLKELFGEMYIPEKGFSVSNEMNPSDSYLVPLSRLLFVHYIGKNRINNIQLNLTMRSKATEKQIVFPVALTQYKCKGQYIFPVKGSINIVSLQTNYVQHRASTNQEFAIDIWDIRFDENVQDYMISKSNPAKLSDYYIYHRDVLAVGDGEVIEVGDKFPEELMNDPSAYSAEYFQQLRKEFTPKIGFVNFIRGNYILIDHKNGEYSFYGHLSDKGIRVRAGNKIKQGDVIAKVGNTGHSDAPHLHFHLIDSPNCYEANGLPIYFKNLPDNIIGFDISEPNSLIHSDFLYLFIPHNK